MKQVSILLLILQGCRSVTEVGVVEVGVYGAGAARAGAARRAWSTGRRCTGSRPELETVNK